MIRPDPGTLQYSTLIANITIVDDYLNKRSIRARAPSKYIADYMKQNQDINKALAAHLIGDPVSCGILTDDYQLFFRKRLERFSEDLQKRLRLQPNDRC